MMPGFSSQAPAATKSRIAKWTSTQPFAIRNLGTHLTKLIAEPRPSIQARASEAFIRRSHWTRRRAGATKRGTFPVLARADHDRHERLQGEKSGEAGAGWLQGARVARLVRHRNPKTRSPFLRVRTRKLARALEIGRAHV